MSPPSTATSRRPQDKHVELEDTDCEIDHLALGCLCGHLTEELMDENSSGPIFLSVFHNKKTTKGDRAQSSRRGKASENISFLNERCFFFGIAEVLEAWLSSIFLMILQLKRV